MAIQASKVGVKISVANEVWVATALLHREHPTRQDFAAVEIAARAERENLYGRVRPGVYVHANQHCVANRRANPATYRMLFATGKTTRRLFRPSDISHPSRERGRMLPERADLPVEYRYLLDWYSEEYAPVKAARGNADPILGLRGLGKEIWDEDPDSYVQRLREGWS